MKQLLQAVLLLGLTMPAFGAAPEVDFDGARVAVQTDGLTGFKNLPSQEFTIPTPGEGIAAKGVTFEPRQGLSAPVKDSNATTVPIVETKVLRITETGVAVEVPAMEVDGKGYFKFKPNDIIEHKIWCPSQSGYWGVCYDYKFDPRFAGHNHITNIPPYTWNGQPIAAHRCYSNIPVTTAITFYFKAPEFSTRADHAAQASGACQGTILNIVDIKIDGLVSLPPAWSDGLHGGVTYYNLIGDKPYHPVNHFGKPQTIDLLKEIAWQYHTEFPRAEVLNINDISLKWGGLFDVKEDTNGIHIPWVMPHEFHRYGRQADLRLWSIPTGNQARLKKISCDLGVEVELHKNNTKLDPIEAAIWENTDFSAPPWKSLTAEELDARIPHYHLVFPKYDTDVDNPVDQAPQGCP